MKTKTTYSIFLAIIITACSSNNVNENMGTINNPNNTNNGNNSSGVWLVPISDIKDGGPGKDGIPSIDNTNFTSAGLASNLNDDDLLIGTIANGSPKAYPHKILDWHEIINDDSTTISYCPLTGTAFGWESYIDEEETTFGVSGLLYNSNLILYDRKTGSNWSQLRLECINGKHIEDKPTLTKIIETNWKTWRNLYPNTKVLSTNTGFDRDYTLYPYGDYKTNNSRFIFTATPSNDALPNKQRVFAIMDGNGSKVYQFSDFNNGKAIKDTFRGKAYLIVGNENLINAFEIDNTLSNSTFSYTFNNSGDTFFEDDTGNKYSVFGNVLSGPHIGEVLKTPASVVSFWFAIASFYPNPEIYSN